MKRLLVSTVLLLSLVTAATAQSLVGTWTYKEPVGRVEGLNLGKMGNAMFRSLFNSGVKKEVAHELDSLGINKKNCSITFSTGGSFRLNARGGYVSGTYKYDSGKSEVTLAANNGYSTTGAVEFDGSKMSLVYPMDDYIDFMNFFELALYKDDIPDEAMEKIKAEKEEYVAEMQKMQEKMQDFGKDEDVNPEDAQKVKDIFGSMKLFMGLTFAK